MKPETDKVCNIFFYLVLEAALKNLKVTYLEERQPTLTETEFQKISVIYRKLFCRTHLRTFPLKNCSTMYLIIFSVEVVIHGYLQITTTDTTATETFSLNFGKFLWNAFFKKENASLNKFANVNFILGIIHLIRAQNFPKNELFSPPDTHT